MGNATKDFMYDEEREVPFQEHMTKHFCRNNVECYKYFMNYFARKVQRLEKKNEVGVVLKSTKQGVRNGRIEH